MQLTSLVLKSWRKELLDTDYLISNTRDSLKELKTLYKRKIEEIIYNDPFSEEEDQDRSEADLLMKISHFDCVLKTLEELNQINERSREEFNTHCKAEQ